MANYITRQSGNKAGLSADVQNLMPYLQNELAVIRKKDERNIAAANALKQAAMENPDDYRGTAFIANRDGTLGMNDPAMRLGEVKRDEDMSQKGENSETQSYDIEGTNKLVSEQMDKLQSDPGRATTVRQQQEIGSLNIPQIAELGMNNSRADGKQIVDGVPSLDARVTNPITQADGSTITEQQVASDNAYGANYGMPAATKDIVPFRLPEEKKSEPVATSKTPVESVADLHKQTGLNASVSESKKQGYAEGKSLRKGGDWKLITDVSSGASELETDPIKSTTTKTRANITDSDQSNLKQLRRATAIERAMNFQAGGTDAAPVMNAMKDRLLAREKFLQDISASKGMTSTKQEVSGGKVKAELGEVKASATIQSGQDSTASTNIALNNAANLKADVDTGNKNSDDKGGYSTGTDTSGATAQFTRDKDGYVTGNDMQTSKKEMKLNNRKMGWDSLKEVIQGENKYKMEGTTKVYPSQWSGVDVIIKDGDHPALRFNKGFRMSSNDYNQWIADGGDGNVKSGENRANDVGETNQSNGSRQKSNYR